MAKAKTKKAVVTHEAGGPPAHLAGRMEADAGKGVSTKQEDNLVPLIYVLQSNSPQCSKRSPDYIEGAEAGDIWMRGSEPPIIKGEDGFIFQPCFFSKDWVEWIPRDAGGGYVGRHKDCPEEAVATPDPANPNRIRFIMPNGHELIETRYHVGYAFFADGRAVPYVIPFSSSGHTVSRAWMFLINAKQVNGSTAFSGACRYRLTTKHRSNMHGDWFMFDVADAGWVEDLGMYERGIALHSAFSEGSKVVEDDQSTAGGETSDSSSAAM